MKKMLYERVLETGFIPDYVIRGIIRFLCRQRLKSITKESLEKQLEYFWEINRTLNQSVLADVPEKANEQHYEVPASFYELVLGQHLKYSSALWTDQTRDLNDAEHLMLKTYCERAQLVNGQDILELGCGWGSLTLFMAEHYPDSNITVLSNSYGQRCFIEERLKQRGLKNVTIYTQDINEFKLEQTFDRMVSIEMFEHVRNYKRLFGKIYDWLKVDGKIFIHIFTHKSSPYLFEDNNAYDWMSRYFFSGGVMPSNELFLYNCAPLHVENHWIVNGMNYEKTSNAWLENMDRNIREVRVIFKEVYGEESEKYIQYWRIFFMAVAELFAYRKGEEWMVNHYLFVKK